jgi:hypothetical protein
MPYIIAKNFSDYSVVNPISGHIYSKHTTFNRAKKQLAVLTNVDESLKQYLPARKNSDPWIILGRK